MTDRYTDELFALPSEIAGDGRLPRQPGRILDAIGKLLEASPR